MKQLKRKSTFNGPLSVDLCTLYLDVEAFEEPPEDLLQDIEDRLKNGIEQSFNSLHARFGEDYSKALKNLQGSTVDNLWTVVRAEYQRDLNTFSHSFYFKIRINLEEQLQDEADYKQTFLQGLNNV